MGKKKILIIDYDQSSLASLRTVLSKEGYEIVTAADGQAGWDKYNKESPDLILMEAMLPKVHGFELCQRITSERNSQATVFIMTGVYKDRVYRTEALRTYGASEYFEKPLKMAELLASIEAVIGKPEAAPTPRPAEPQPVAEAVAAKPVREIKPEPAPIEPKKREKPKSDEDMFSLPADLDRLSRELPKTHKPVPARREPAFDARIESLADELLKTVVVEAAAPKPVQAKPTGGNGNGNGNADIDQFLKSALAGFDLDKEKVKAPKPAPPAPPPVEDKPLPAPPTVAPFKPKPAPPVPPTPPVPPVVEKLVIEKPKPAPLSELSFSSSIGTDAKNTLTPGDPGSDVSPFFTPGKPKPEAPVEKARTQAPVAPPVTHVLPAKPFKPAEKVEKKAAPAPAPEPVRREPARPAPVKPEPVKPEPVRREPDRREAEAIASTNLFDDIGTVKTKKGFPTLLAVGLGIAAVAAVGFVLLRPKPAPPAEQTQQAAPQTVTQSNVPPQTVEQAPPPVVKPAPAKQKAQPQTKPANTANNAQTGADAIIPTDSGSAALPPIGLPAGPGTANGQTASGTNAAQTDTPPVKTESNPQQTTETPAGAAGDAGAATAAPAPLVPQVNEGDLVDLGSVTEPPKLIKSVDPVYPQAAQRIGRGGSITVNALIDEKGNVIDTGIIKGIQDDKGLGRAAQTALKKWKFQPARKNGVAVKVWKSFVIAFKADSNRPA
jgi:TonB family protein